MQALQVSDCGKWTLSPPAPTPSSLRASGCTAVLEKSGSSGLGIVGETGTEGGWRDAGASHWIRDLSAFSEERRPLGGPELLFEEECQGEMFGGLEGGGALEEVGSAGCRSSVL